MPSQFENFEDKEPILNGSTKLSFDSINDTVEAFRMLTVLFGLITSPSKVFYFGIENRLSVATS